LRPWRCSGSFCSRSKTWDTHAACGGGCGEAGH